MKQIAKLLLFFSLSFCLIFALALGIACLSNWVEILKELPERRFAELGEFIPGARWALSFTLYMSILLNMTYALRKRMHPMGALFIIFAASFGFTWAVSQGIFYAERMNTPPIVFSSHKLGENGLVLKGKGIAIVLMDGPASSFGRRVIALEGRPLILEETPVGAEGGPIPLPPFRFAQKNDSAFGGLVADIAVSGNELARRFAENSESFATYLGALILILVSLASLLDIGAWPLANMFLGALLFRGIIFFEAFILRRDVQDYIEDFLHPWVPSYLAIPVAIGVVGLIFIVYSMLNSISRSGRPLYGRRAGDTLVHKRPKYLGRRATDVDAVIRPKNTKSKKTGDGKKDDEAFLEELGAIAPVDKVKVGKKPAGKSAVNLPAAALPAVNLSAADLPAIDPTDDFADGLDDMSIDLGELEAAEGEVG
jgi:hypothetical protein